MLTLRQKQVTGADLHPSSRDNIAGFLIQAPTAAAGSNKEQQKGTGSGASQWDPQIAAWSLMNCILGLEQDKFSQAAKVCFCVCLCMCVDVCNVG